jgi:RNA polymerase sigma-70 factor (ECF subfamily)
MVGLLGSEAKLPGEISGANQLDSPRPPGARQPGNAPARGFVFPRRESLRGAPAVEPCVERRGYRDVVVWKLSDESLLAGLGSGDRDAAAAFVARFERRVFGLTRSILRDRGAAEEAAQEAFVRAWRHASAYDPRRGSVAVWLLTIARNVSINMLPARRFDPIDPEVLLAMEASKPRDEAASSQEIGSEPLRAALRRLPEEQRRVLVMAVLYGYTAKEMSELDGLPLGTVKTRIRSAMMKLRAELGVSDDR